MLIVSHRHTAKDLESWRVHHASDVCRSTKALAEKAKRAVELIERFQPDYVSTSWGKDSVVVCHLAWQAGFRGPFMHLRPTNHNPDVDLVRDAFLSCYPCEVVDQPVDYSSVDRDASLDEIDKATDKLWFAAIREFGKQHGFRCVLGIRAEESGIRSLRAARWGEESPMRLAPIIRWDTDEVFAYLAQNALPVHPAYACLGGGRWDRRHLRVAEIGDTHGARHGRRQWETEYYGDALRRMEAMRCSSK
jgi:phosphoadenosine phosphosulfate reductase